MDQDRYRRGLDRLRQLGGEEAMRAVEGLSRVSPDLARLVVEFPYGDVHSRPGLDIKSREIATMAALITLGHANAQLEMHIDGALNVGCTRQEVMEVVIQMAVYAGFPAAINAMQAAARVFERRDAQGRRDG